MHILKGPREKCFQTDCEDNVRLFFFCCTLLRRFIFDVVVAWPVMLLLWFLLLHGMYQRRDIFFPLTLSLSLLFPVCLPHSLEIALTKSSTFIIACCDNIFNVLVLCLLATDIYFAAHIFCRFFCVCPLLHYAKCRSLSFSAGSGVRVRRIANNQVPSTT